MPLSQIVPIAEVVPGDVLAANVYDNQELLFREGSVLNRGSIDRLTRRGLQKIEIYPADEHAQDMLLYCEACTNRLDLRPPRFSGTPAQAWVCKGCVALYFGNIAAPGPGIAPMDVSIQATRLIATPSLGGTLAKQRSEGELVGGERRSHARHLMSLPVTVAPLSERFRIIGEAMLLETHDVSQSGVCLKHACPLTAPHVYLDFTPPTGSNLKMIASVVNTQIHGSGYTIGTKYICRVVDHETEPTAAPACEKAAT